MLKLKTIGKDRRCKLTEENIKSIISLWFDQELTMQEIADRYKISHQRVSQIVDRNGTMKDRRKAYARKHLRKYQTDKKYRVKMSELKRGYRIYKLKMIKNYERQQAKKKVG